MKNFSAKVALFFLLFNLQLCILFAQAPSKMSFQQVIRNSGGVLITGTTVGMRISILQGSSIGTAVYVEIQTPVTNANGLATFFIGNGSVVSGSIDSINWGAGPYYLKSDTDPAGGTSYSISATQQLVSVPYALYARSAGIGGGTTGIKPTVTTDSVRNIAITTCTVYGNAISCGSELIIYRGFCIDTTAIPSLSSARIVSGVLLGVYSLNVTGLLPSTHYHVRAFASNSVGTSFGDTLSFTTNAISIPNVVTDSIYGITSISASGDGTVTSDGGLPVTSRGICYDTIPMPTIASHISLSGSGTGLFSTTLSPLNTSHTYYARAYATNSLGTAYGAQITFSTLLTSVPVITTDSVTPISYTTATSGVNVLSTGGYTITAQGVCWHTAMFPLPTTSGPHLATATGLGDYPVNITGLMAGTTYFVRAYSTNSLGTAYGNLRVFTTSALSIPVLTTNSVIGITAVSATCGGNITGGSGTVTARGVCWSRTTTPTKDSSHTVDGTGTGVFNSNMTGLSAHTTYYVRAYATNATGTGYGALHSFTTDSFYISSPTVPIVGTDLPIMTGSSTGSCGGVVTIDGGSPVTARGICWGTSPHPTTAGVHTTDGTGLGYFSSIITPISGCASIYYIRAYGINSIGTGYGNEYSLSTGLLPVLTTLPATSITTTSAISGGNITSDGGCPITARGICYIPAIYDTPSLTNGYTISLGTGSGIFTSTLTGLGSNVTYYVRSYATNSIGTVYGPVQMFTTSTPTTLYIGEPYAGGIIFYLDSTHLHGMVCANTDIDYTLWGCYGTDITGTDTVFGSGAINTAAIIAGCNDTTIAAYKCFMLHEGGYNDWFLPAYQELDTMAKNLIHIGIGNFDTYNTDNRYYSSSQSDPYDFYDLSNSLIFPYNQGYGAGGPKNWGNFTHARAVRKF